MSAKPEAAATPPAKRPPKHLTPRQVREAIELWEQGAVTLGQLAKRYDKHADTFSKLFKRVGAERGSKKEKLDEKIKREAEEQLLAEAAETTVRIKETRESSYNTLKNLHILTWYTIKKCRDENAAVGTVERDIKTLRMAAETIEITRRGRFNILGLDKDNAGDTEIDKLVVEVLSDDDIREKAAAARLADEEDDLDEMEDIEEIEDVATEPKPGDAVEDPAAGATKPS